MSSLRFAAAVVFVFATSCGVPAAEAAIMAFGRSLSATCADFCASRPSGIYSNPCDSTCSTYFSCANGVTYKQQCPGGTLFNPVISVCDWPSNVNCNGGDGGPPPPSARPPPPTRKKSPPPKPTKKSPPPPPSPSIGRTSPPPPASRTELVFSPYKDITINMDWNTNVISSSVDGSRKPVTQVMPSNLKVLTWAFATGECGTETWGGVTPSSLVSANVQAFVSAGKKYIVSTGGAAGGFRCGGDQGFLNFIRTYYSSAMIGVDFDIEVGQAASDIRSLVQRVQAARAGGYSNLRYSFTIATLGGASGNQLNPTGTATVQAIKDSQLGWDRIYVNLMVMDYGSGGCVARYASSGLCDMAQSAINAANALHSYWGVPYTSIELTPMIGGNDVIGETFTLQDVARVSEFVKQYNIAGVHVWSLDRDKDCPPGSASPTCNSYGQAGTLGFTKAFLTALGL